MSLNQLEIYIQHFIQKCVQVIVQSRLGTERTQTKCNPNGQDLFSLNIDDIKDIYEQTTKCLKHTYGESPRQSLYWIREEWKICCEISMKNSDGITIVLEYWIFSNQPSTSEHTEKDISLSQIVSQTFIQMSNMIKSLIVLTRSTPAHRLSSKGQSADSYVICYRVYQISESLNNFMQSSDQSSHYSNVKTFGVIKNLFNELSMSLIYRSDMNINSESEIKNLAKINENVNETDEILLSLKDDHFKKDVLDDSDMFDIIKPLTAAFATNNNHRLNCDLNIPFSSLLTVQTAQANNNVENNNHHHDVNGLKSNPISIPISSITSKTQSKSPQIYSTSNESFVFVDINAPFAKDDNLFSSFFQGPAPTFANSQENFGDDIIDLSTQLAELESAAPKIDSFVESICLSEGEEFKTGT